MATNEAQFEQLVAQHHSRVLRVCRSVLRDEHLSADAAQETFVRLWKSSEAGRLPERIGPWLMKAALSAAIDLGRRLEARGGPPAASDAERPGDEHEQPAQRAQAGELKDQLELELEKLADGQRTIFLLRHDGGLSLAEIAELLSVGLPTVRTQFARACLKLQAALSTFAKRDDRS